MPRIVLHPHPSRARRGGRAGGGGGTGGAFGTGGPLEQTGYHANLEHAALVASSQLRAQQGAEDARAHAHIEQVHRNRALLAELEATDPDLKSDPRYGYLRGVADTGGDLSHAVQFVSHERDQRAAAEERARAKENARAEQGNRSHLLLDGLAKEIPGFRDSFEFKALKYHAENGGDVMPGVQRWVTEQERAQAKARAIAPAVPEDEAVKMLAAAEPTIAPDRLRGIIQSQRAGITGKFHVSEGGGGGTGRRADPALPNVADTDLAAALVKARENGNLAQIERASTALALRKLTLDENNKPVPVPEPVHPGESAHGVAAHPMPAGAAGMSIETMRATGSLPPAPVSNSHGAIPIPASQAGSPPVPEPAGPVITPMGVAPAPSAPPAPQAQAGPAQPSPYDQAPPEHKAGARAALDRFAQLHGRPADTQNPQDRAALKALLAPLLGAPPAPPAPQPMATPPRPEDQDPYAEGR